MTLNHVNDYFEHVEALNTKNCGSQRLFKLNIEGKTLQHVSFFQFSYVMYYELTLVYRAFPIRALVSQVL